MGILKIVGKNCGNFKIFAGKSALIHLVTLFPILKWETNHIAINELLTSSSSVANADNAWVLLEANRFYLRGLPSSKSTKLLRCLIALGHYPKIIEYPLPLVRKFNNLPY